MRPPRGKLSPEALARLVAPHLGAARSEVLVGPRAGVDCAIVRVGEGRVMAVTTDPLSIVPALGLADSARLACHLVASDLWTTGIAPAYAAVSLHLPPGLDDADLGAFAAAMGAAWDALGVAVVTGHTGRYDGCEGTIVGAATLFGFGDEHRYVGPAFVAAGDRVLITKGCAIETTAIAARLVPERLGRTLDAAGMKRARGMLAEVSVVADCRALLAVGVREQGVTALHDATEGGVLGGLIELALAAGRVLRVERARIPLSAEAHAACEAFGVDPYRALSAGTLIATVRPGRAGAALAVLAAAGIAAADVGEVGGTGGALELVEPGGEVVTLREPPPDPYWDAYARAVREG